MDVPGLLEKTHLFHGVAADDLQAVAQVAAPVSLAVGEAVYDSGSAADALYLMEIGTVEMRARGGEQVLATYGSGQVFGEVPFFGRSAERTRVSRAVAREHCSLLRIAYADLERLLTARPALAAAVYRNACLFVTQALRELMPHMQRPYF